LVERGLAMGDHHDEQLFQYGKRLSSSYILSKAKGVDIC
jgi:hypothetical protein